MFTRGRLFEQAFEEFKVTRQVSTGNGAMYVASVEYKGRTPGWFIRHELGYDGPCGVRLYQMVPQCRLESRHQQAARTEELGVAAPEAMPKAPRKQRETRHSRRAKLEQLEARALANQYAA